MKESALSTSNISRKKPMKPFLIKISLSAKGNSGFGRDVIDLALKSVKTAVVNLDAERYAMGTDMLQELSSP
jgi:hypothetical protein